MNYLIKIILITFLISGYNLFGQQNDTIYYSTRNKIVWDDFKNTTSDTISKAKLATGIRMETRKVNIWTGVATVDAYGFVCTSQSAVNPNYKDEIVLRHQQLYFDLSELIARRLETDINERKLNAARRKRMTEIFASYNIQLQQMQEQYAVETNLGMDENKQTEWEKRVTAELTKYTQE